MFGGNPSFRGLFSCSPMKMASPTIYRNVESVLSVLNNNKSDNVEGVSVLLEVYNKASKACNENVASSNSNGYPLIILEGLDGCGKSTTCRQLASKFNAAQWCTPPESIKHIRHLFDDHLQLRTAYYALGNYIAALECSVIQRKQPVVMDRYWHSTAAYAIAQAVHDFPGNKEMPPQGDPFYQWPDDLLKPDAVIFLNVSEHTRLQRLSRRTNLTTQESLLKNSLQFRNNIILAYRNMVNPEVIFVDSNTTVNQVVGEIVAKVKYLFKSSV